MDICLLPPSIVSDYVGYSWTGGSVLAPVDDNIVSLMQWAADRAFHALSIPFMRRLSHDHGWKPPRGQTPSSAEQWASYLMFKAIPFLSDERAGQIIDLWRGTQKRKGPWKSCIDASSVNVIEGIMDPDDVSQVRKRVNTDAVHKDVHQLMSRASAQKQKPRKLTWKVDDIIPFEDAKAMLPERIGCTLKKDDHKLYRWQVAYPARRHPFSKSKQWGDDMCERDALYEVLGWAWDEHVYQHPGTVCPYDFHV